MKEIIKKIPIFGSIFSYINRTWINQTKAFQGSEKYWIDRYEEGGNSGDGSYNQLAEFKAEILNKFVTENNIKSVIEYGCGDGNQLSLAKYSTYIGFDVSEKAIDICMKKFIGDKSKTFKLMSDYDGESAELTLSLDVIYHLIEDGTFINYMNRLFDSSNKYIIIYSSNTDINPKEISAHVKHRAFTKWVTENKPEWALKEYIPNRYPFKENSKKESFADFFIYIKN